MKTSNKILLLIGIIILASILISAIIFKVKLDNGDFTYVKDIKSNLGFQMGNIENKRIDLDQTVESSILILPHTLSNIEVNIIKDSIAHITYNEDFPFKVIQENGQLILYPDPTPTNQPESKKLLKKSNKYVNIHLPHLKALSNTILDKSIQNKRTGPLDYKISINHFEGDQLIIKLFNIGHIDLTNLIVENMDLQLEQVSTANLNNNNRFETLKLTGNGSVEFTISPDDLKIVDTDFKDHAKLTIEKEIVIF